MDLICQDVHFGLGEKKILKGVSLKVEGNQFHTILGPNGSGKTSLLKLLYRQEKADKGLISLDGKPLEQWTIKETAKQMAVVTQFNQLQFDCTVEEIVLLGRTPHLSFLQKEKEKDQDHICEKAVKQLESHRSLFENLMRSIKNEEVRNILDVSSKRFFDYVIDSISEEIDASPQDKELISSMCQHGVRGLLIEWLSRENASSQSLSDLLMRANYLFNGVIVMALKRSEQRSRL